MKELSIEEKAKRYDESIKRAKDINREHSERGFKPSEDVLYIFPELAESEEEKLSKKLHECVCRAINNDKLPYEERKYISEKVIPYLENLEKQKEQKATWSKEDENHLLNCINYFTGITEFSPFYKDFLWLKSLKKRMQPQSIQELSKEVIIEYVDLGLPSGTLWKLTNEEGYYTFDEAVDKFGDKLPTKEQWKELKDECKWGWKGAGYEITGPNGNMIYLPAVGYGVDKGVYDVGMSSAYWSLTDEDEDYAWEMYFDKNDLDMYEGLRYYYRSVRLVK